MSTLELELAIQLKEKGTISDETFWNIVKALGDRSPDKLSKETVHPSYSDSR